MSNLIAGLAVTVGGSRYHYEAHTMHRVAEILAGTLRVLDSGETNDFGQTVYSDHIQDFEILYFEQV